MSKTKKRIWKRRRWWAAIFVLLLLSGVLWIAFTRLYFSHQDFEFLAKLQHRQPEIANLNNNRPVIVAHRGVQVGVSKDGRAIGNTASAIELGTQSGSDWIEIDILLTKDGVLVVFHDTEVDHKTNGKGKVADKSLAELREIDVVGLDEGPEKILTLDEVFEQFDSEQLRWILDIKAGGIEAEVLQWLDKRNQLKEQDRVILFGKHEILDGYVGSGYPLGYTETWSGFANQLRVLCSPSVIIDRAERLNCKYIALPILLSNQSLVDAAIEKGFEVWISSGDDIRDLEHAAARGISGVIVYDPKKVVEYFSKGSP